MRAMRPGMPRQWLDRVRRSMARSYAASTAASRMARDYLLRASAGGPAGSVSDTGSGRCREGNATMGRATAKIMAHLAHRCPQRCRQRCREEAHGTSLFRRPAAKRCWRRALRQPSSWTRRYRRSRAWRADTGRRERKLLFGVDLECTSHRGLYGSRGSCPTPCRGADGASVDPLAAMSAMALR